MQLPKLGMSRMFTNNVRALKWYVVKRGFVKLEVFGLVAKCDFIHEAVPMSKVQQEIKSFSMSISGTRLRISQELEFSTLTYGLD